MSSRSAPSACSSDTSGSRASSPAARPEANRHDARASLGARGEAAALALYRRSGFRLLARNWRCPAGELDLVVERGGVIVVCEVKTRSGSAFGAGYESVTWSKRRRLRRLAEAFVIQRRRTGSPIRFDVVSVHLERSGRPDVVLFQDAF
ncbi:MAG: YraN family protein [Actinomycetota bacterium]